MRAASSCAGEPSSGDSARGRSVTVWVSGDVARTIETLALERHLAARNAAFALALKAGLRALGPTDQPPTLDAKRKRGRAAGEAFERLWFRSTTGEKGRIEAFKVRHRYRDLSAALSDLVTRALDAED